MTDWSRLHHAYGPADGIPALLDRIATEPEPELWNDLWSALCHQGSVYPASFAALPWLAGVAEADDREQSVNALGLAGSIMAAAGPPHGTDHPRARYAVEVQRLLTAADRRLRTASDHDGADYVHLLEAVLGFEGVVGWSEELAWGLDNEEYQIDCPGCRTDLFVVLGERGFFSSSEDHALADGDVETRPLLPADPADLDGIGRRLHDLALSDGQHRVAHALTHVFGHATCPDCGTRFSVADRIVPAPPAAP
ncbi:hypothetical protein JNUCC64_14915 [Streptomyces sp. JNUCC 64]